MVNKLVYLIFIAVTWLVYVGFTLPILLLFMSFGQSCHVAMIIATVMTILFILVQRTFRGLHLINRLQDDTADIETRLQLANGYFQKSMKQVNKQNRHQAKVYCNQLKQYQHQLKAYQKNQKS